MAESLNTDYSDLPPDAVRPNVPFEFHREDDGTISLASAVFQALGAASVCWSNPPTGIFESDRAKEIGEKLIEFIENEAD